MTKTLQMKTEIELNANELRVGNWIQQRPKNNPLMAWRNIQVDADVIKNIERGQSYFDYQPVPLSEELLMNNGFKQHGHKNDSNPLIHKSGNFEFAIYRPSVDYRRKYWLTTIHESINSHERLYIPFVHDLQNFYFAIRRTELEIDLP
jgi:hypothetical protein